MWSMLVLAHLYNGHWYAFFKLSAHVWHSTRCTQRAVLQDMVHMIRMCAAHLLAQHDGAQPVTSPTDWCSQYARFAVKRAPRDVLVRCPLMHLSVVLVPLLIRSCTFCAYAVLVAGSDRGKAIS